MLSSLDILITYLYVILNYTQLLNAQCNVHNFSMLGVMC